MIWKSKCEFDSSSIQVLKAIRKLSRFLLEHRVQFEFANRQNELKVEIRVRFEFDSSSENDKKAKSIFTRNTSSIRARYASYDTCELCYLVCLTKSPYGGCRRWFSDFQSKTPKQKRWTEENYRILTSWNYRLGTQTVVINCESVQSIFVVRICLGWFIY